MNREGNSPPSRQSPYSPFPFGSPLGTMSSRKSPETGGANGLQSSTTSPNRTAFPNNSFLKSRVRAQEAYGGKNPIFCNYFGRLVQFYDLGPILRLLCLPISSYCNTVFLYIYKKNWKDIYR